MSALADRVLDALETAHLTGVTLGLACREDGISTAELDAVLGSRADIALAYRRLSASKASGGAVLANGHRHNTARSCAVSTCETIRDGRDFCTHHRGVARTFWRELAADLRNGRIRDGDYPKPGE